ncbi:uncharacterized protein LOC131025790 [Salvia miltiorrhiza]|uniref:uncharacterized protein LOC131025790 n=1 Tax=Salvia miltiorrhiza TaxID=226208 RepID=UPI0025ACE5D7|nr:uncharacterized protein LOC131025790 [Salvia miltiorrhiza]
MTEALKLFIFGCSPRCGLEDGWDWKAMKDGRFSTKSAYEALVATRSDSSAVTYQNETSGKIWDAPAPFKARVTAWRCLRNRLATCDNLIKRKVALQVEDSWCNSCAAQEETAAHLFLHCPKTEQVWDLIQQWVGQRTARPQGILQHFFIFVHGGRGKSSKKFLKALWICTVWLIWKSLNESRFEGKVCDAQKLVLEIKGRMWSWNHSFGTTVSDACFSKWCSREFTTSFLY